MEDISDHISLRHELLNRKIFPSLADHITTFLVNTLLPTTDLVMDSGKKKYEVKKFINKGLVKYLKILCLQNLILIIKEEILY